MELDRKFRKIAELGIGITAVAILLAACGGGGGGSAAAGSTTTTVTPFKGMFTSGRVTLTDANGNAVPLLAGGSINASGVASVTYAAGAAYPLTVSVTGAYLDETTGASAVTSVPLRGLIPGAREAAAASGVPVTAITEIAVAHLLRQIPTGVGITAASAVQAITGAASGVLGQTYTQAMTPPVFDARGHTADPATLRLAALAVVANARGTGSDLAAKLRSLAQNLAAGSAVNAAIPQTDFDLAVAAVNGGASSVLSGAAPVIPPYTIPASTLAVMIASASPIAPAGGAPGYGIPGYPATVTHTGRLSDGRTCSVTVDANHNATLTAAGQTISTLLDGYYSETTNGEFAAGRFYTGTMRFYSSSNSVPRVSASAGTPAHFLDITLDAASGQLIAALGQIIKDPNFINPAAGSNFTAMCAGGAFPAGAPVDATGFNAAAPSRFAATTLAGGPFTAPTAANAACSFTVDATGNASITWAGFTTTAGKLVLPYDRLTAASAQSTTTAVYEVYYTATGVLAGQMTSAGNTVLTQAEAAANPERFNVTLANASGVKTATVLANSSSNNAKSVTCSTANDPVGKWLALGAKAKTYTGLTDRNSNLKAVGTGWPCSVTIAANGATDYTDSLGGVTHMSPALGSPILVSNNYFDLGTNSLSLALDFSTPPNPTMGNYVLLSKNGVSQQEYCANLR